MLEIVHRMFLTRPTAKIEALARQVAEVSLDEVACLVASRIEEMTLSEARGYVRARSAAVVRRQTRLAVNRHPQATVEWQTAIVRAATDKIIPQVLRKVGVGVPRLSPQRLAA